MKEKSKSRNPFKNRYFVYTLVYLCLLGILAAGLSFSRYTTEDSAADSAIATADNVYITGENVTQDAVETLAMNVYATSKLSESSSFVEHTYQRIQINIINESDCTVALSDFSITEADGTDSVYEMLAIDMTNTDYETYESKSYYGDTSAAVLAYINDNCAVSLGSSTESVTYTYDVTDAADVSDAVDAATESTFTTLEEGTASAVLQHGGTVSFCVMSWVEHDNVYKDDADAETADQISHSTLTELGIGTQEFTFSVHSEQVD